MNGLDFRRATDLFLASEQELALALGLSLSQLADYRKDPRRVPPEVMKKLGKVLIERGRGMIRVGEMLSEE